MQEVDDDEACCQLHSEFRPTLDGDTVGDNLKEVGEDRNVAHVSRDHTAHSNLAPTSDEGKHGIEDLAADVLKVPVGKLVTNSRGEVGLEVGVLVVYAVVGTERLDPVALLLSSRNTNDLLGANDILGELNGTRANGTDVSGVSP